jgi:hypothetical protein
MRTKVQGHSSIAKVKRAHQISMHRTSKSITSPRMDADRRKIRTKILGLHGKKVRAEHMTPGEIINKPEAAIQAEAEAVAETKKYLFIACSTRKTPTINKGLPYFPRVQKEDDPKTQPTINHPHNQRSQPYIPLAATVAIILLKSTFVPEFQPPPRVPIQLLQIPLTILPTISLHDAHKPSPHTPTSNHLSFGTFTNNISCRKLPNSSTKDRIEQSTSTPTAKPILFSTIN